jgi:hypothetical protein
MKLFAVVMACALVGACEKAGDHKGALSPEDMALLEDLPGGNTLLIGGNYMKIQGFMDSSFGKFTARTMAKDTGQDPAAYKAWSECFMNMPHISIAGGVKFAGTLDMRFAFKGITIAQVNDCVAKANYKATLDPDGKYIGVDVPGPGGQMMQAGYLALPDGAILLDQQMKLGLAPTLVPGSRAQLEEIAGKLASDNAAGDKHLIDLAAKTDRSKTFWFAGTGAGTPFANKVGDIYGAFEVQNGGISTDATIVFTDTSLASNLDDGVAKAKQNAEHMPPAFKSVVDSVKLQRTGGTVHVSASLSADQISAFAALTGMQ